MPEYKKTASDVAYPLRVVRFSNHNVDKNLRGVCEAIESAGRVSPSVWQLRLPDSSLIRGSLITGNVRIQSSAH